MSEPEFEQVLQSIQYQDNDSAIEIVEKMLQQNDAIECQLLLATLFTNSGRYDQAKNRYWLVLDKNPDNELARIQLALLHFSLNEHKHVMYLLSPYLLWQTQITCISSLANALISLIQGKQDAYNLALDKAIELDLEKVFQPVTQELRRVSASISFDVTASRATNQLLTNLYSNKY